MENLNLCDLLRNCEPGMKLYSPAYGEMTFVKVGSMPARNGEYVICNLSDSEDYPLLYIYFKDNGILMIGNCSECMIFPSKDNRDWKAFKKPYKFKQSKREIYWFSPTGRKEEDNALLAELCRLTNTNWRPEEFEYNVDNIIYNMGWLVVEQPAQNDQSGAVMMFGTRIEISKDIRMDK